MENYNQEKRNNMNGDENDGTNNLSQYTGSATPVLMTTGYHHHHHHHMNKDGGGGAGGDYFCSALVPVPTAHHVVEENPIVKSESTSNHHQQQQQQSNQRFYNYPLHHLNLHQQNQEHDESQQQQQRGRNCNRFLAAGGGSNNNNEDGIEVMKVKIMSHPQYSNLLQAFMDCQKVGAPPEVAAKLTAIRHEFETRHHHHNRISSSSSSNKDPELDQFMEAYYDLLVKYKEEITKPVQEAIEFMACVESQLNSLTHGARPHFFSSDERSAEGYNAAGVLSEEEQQENSGGETELPEIDPRSEDRELKYHLLRKYSGYLGSLKQELSKKKKKGKLPKDARQKLLSWWELHYKWPYPSESEKVALAEATGLDQKQINNWFINQRKRHWKPSEDMQFMVMDGLLPPQSATAAFYMEGGHYLGDGPYRFGT